jgi:hypothetical protein
MLYVPLSKFRQSVPKFLVVLLESFSRKKLGFGVFFRRDTFIIDWMPCAMNL